MSIDTGKALELAIDVGLKVLELAADLAPGLIAVIDANGSYTEEQKAALRARVRAARSKVAEYEPRDV